MFLASAIRAAGFSPLLRQRMSPELLVDEPFRQLARAAEQIREHAESSAPDAHAQLLRDAQYLRALLDACRRCAASVHEHLEAHGVSVDVVFEVDQLRERAHRIDLLLGCVLSEQPAKDLLRFVVELVARRRRAALDPRPLRQALFAARAQGRRAQRRHRRALHHARRRANTGRCCAPRPAAAPCSARRRFIKFGSARSALAAFWAGFAAGLNYAARSC